MTDVDTISNILNAIITDIHKADVSKTSDDVLRIARMMLKQSKILENKLKRMYSTPTYVSDRL